MPHVVWSACLALRPSSTKLGIGVLRFRGQPFLCGVAHCRDRFCRAAHSVYCKCRILGVETYESSICDSSRQIRHGVLLFLACSGVVPSVGCQVLIKSNRYSVNTANGRSAVCTLRGWFGAHGMVVNALYRQLTAEHDILHSLFFSSIFCYCLPHGGVPSFAMPSWPGRFNIVIMIVG